SRGGGTSRRRARSSQSVPSDCAGRAPATRPPPTWSPSCAAPRPCSWLEPTRRVTLFRPLLARAPHLAEPEMPEQALVVQHGPRNAAPFQVPVPERGLRSLLRLGIVARYVPSRILRLFEQRFRLGKCLVRDAALAQPLACQLALLA